MTRKELLAHLGGEMNWLGKVCEQKVCSASFSRENSSGCWPSASQPAVLLKISLFCL